MKRFFALTLTVLLLLASFPVAAFASPTDELVSTTTEYFEDGSYLITNVYKNAVQPRTGENGYKDSTYYTESGTKIFKVTVTGSFEYYYGVSSSAKSASVSVSLYSTKASFVSKNAYTDGASAIGTGTISYLGTNITRTVVLTCDKYGNLY